MGLFKADLFNVCAPASGRVVALFEVQDEVFKKKMMGDGLAIEPIDGEFVAPFDGVVMHLPQTKHSIIIQGENGISVLVHMGLDTVYLNGSVFHCLVSEGKAVRCGDLMAKMDLEEVIKKGKSIISPVIVIDKKDAKLKKTDQGVVKKQDLLFAVQV